MVALPPVQQWVPQADLPEVLQVALQPLLPPVDLAAVAALALPLKARLAAVAALALLLLLVALAAIAVLTTVQRTRMMSMVLVHFPRPAVHQCPLEACRTCFLGKSSNEACAIQHKQGTSVSVVWRHIPLQ